MEITENLLKRFWAKVDKRGPDECWEWTAGRDADDYGMLRIGADAERAHRVSWVIHHGPIPIGAHALHRCDNRACVNPHHLFLGTQVDNMRDMIAKGRGGYLLQQGEQNCHAKLTVADVLNIRAEVASGKTHRVVARIYGISYQHVSSIANRKSWAHIE